MTADTIDGEAGSSPIVASILSRIVLDFVSVDTCYHSRKMFLSDYRRDRRFSERIRLDTRLVAINPGPGGRGHLAPVSSPIGGLVGAERAPEIRACDGCVTTDKQYAGQRLFLRFRPKNTVDKNARHLYIAVVLKGYFGYSSSSKFMLMRF
jgi:hypothetical protein